MKFVDKLTQRLDHMVPEKGTWKRNRKEIEQFLKALADEEKQITKKVQR